MKRFEIEAIRPRAVLVIRAGGRVFYAHFEENGAARAFTEKLNSGPLCVVLRGSGIERAADLPWSLPGSGETLNAAPGDLLYREKALVLCLAERETDAVRLARIGNAQKETLLAALGEGETTVDFSLEWSE